MHTNMVKSQKHTVKWGKGNLQTTFNYTIYTIYLNKTWYNCLWIPKSPNILGMLVPLERGLGEDSKEEECCSGLF